AAAPWRGPRRSSARKRSRTFSGRTCREQKASATHPPFPGAAASRGDARRATRETPQFLVGGIPHDAVVETRSGRRRTQRAPSAARIVPLRVRTSRCSGDLVALQGCVGLVDLAERIAQ